MVAFPLLFCRTGATWRRQLDFAERLHFTQPQDIPTNHVKLDYFAAQSNSAISLELSLVQRPTFFAAF